MCFSLQERVAGVRALQLFSKDNWFWNRPELRADMWGWWHAAVGSKRPRPCPFNYCATMYGMCHAKIILQPPPFTQWTNKSFMWQSLSIAGLVFWLEAVLLVNLRDLTDSAPTCIRMLHGHVQASRTNTENTYWNC